MTLTIELTPEEAARLKETAQRQGKQPTAVLHDLVRALPSQRIGIQVEPAPEMTWGARTMAAMKARGIVGVLWQDRPEDSRELAEEFKKRAETRGPLPCDWWMRMCALNDVRRHLLPMSVPFAVRSCPLYGSLMVCCVGHITM